ncbi:MAG: 50S ribosomal protein L21e [Thermoplasmata archaeon]
MVKASKGIRCRTRGILRKKPREKGMPPITHYLQKFEIGEKAAIHLEPSSPEGMPHPRFHGLTGTIVGVQGRCYLVQVREGKKLKQVICAPQHLKRVSE